MGIKFHTPWKTLIIKFPPPWDGKGVKCPSYAPGGGGGGGCWSVDLTDTLLKEDKRSHGSTWEQILPTTMYLGCHKELQSRISPSYYEIDPYQLLS